MVRICLFDVMPFELLYILFTYFFAHEILESFCDISDYVNVCLLTSSAYRLDLQSIEKCDFDNICRRIRAEQVIFLRICDDSNTPGLSKYFFSHFQIGQFTQLRSFILLEIEMDSLELILFNLHKLAQLRSLSFKSNTTKHINHGFQLDYFNEINRIYLKIFNRSPLIISRLNRLHLISSECPKSIQFPYLLHLKVEECSMNELRTIFIRTPSLISLDICLKSEETIVNFVLRSSRFTRLHLRFDNRLISMNILEEFVSKLTCLKYVVLGTHGESDIVNGERWKNLTSNLIEFNLKFDLINCPNPNLNSFRTSFWLKEKHWFVASNFNSVFSIPHFSPSQLILPGQLFIDSTVPNHQLFYNQVTNITIVNVPNDKNEYNLNNIKILNLKCFMSLEIVSSIINLNKVEKLIIPSLDYLFQLKSLSLIMPRLVSLSIIKLITADVIEQILNSKFEQIHNLIIGIDIENDKYIIECLFRLFPRIKSIKCINSINNIIRLIDGFKDLCHASFYYNSSFSARETNCYSHSKFHIVHKRIFTSRISILSNNESKLNINLWLTEQINIRENPIRIDWPIRRAFHWYRIIYICNKNIYFNIVLVLSEYSEEQTRQSIESLQNRIDLISRLNDEYLKELSITKQENIDLIRLINSIKCSNDYLNSNNKSMINNKLKSLFHFPSDFSYLKHLHNKSNILSPSFIRQTRNLNNIRQNISFIIGIPTVKRDKESYLIETIKSLIDNLDNNDNEDLLIIIFVSELFHIEYIRETIFKLEEYFNKYIENGLIEIIIPPIEFYPDFNKLKLSLNDNQQRVQWRTKQNYDFSYLMIYSSTRAKYYIQLEDDLITKPNYIQIIQTFIKKQNNQNWFMLEFSRLGFIGKMFHTSDLDALVNFFLIFSVDKPIDWLLDNYQDTKYCSFIDDIRSCSKTKNLYRFRSPLSLFQHIGIYSSLKGKTQKLKDTNFGQYTKLSKSYENPSVSSIISTLQDYHKHPLVSCYDGHNFFWTQQTEKDDTMEFVYNPPILLSRVYFKSGNPEHPTEKFLNTTVDLQPYVPPKDNVNYIKYNDGFYTVAHFSHETGIAEAFVDKALGPISIIRLKVHSKSNASVVLDKVLCHYNLV